MVEILKAGTGAFYRGVLLFLCALLVISLIFCGCSDDDEDEGGGSEASSTTTESDVQSSGGGVNESGSEAVSSTVQESGAGIPAASRPEENAQIEIKDTLLYHAFDNVDKYHLYIRSVQNVRTNTGYATHYIEYAFSGVKIYIHQSINGDELFYLGDGENLYGLDFEERTYTLIAPSVYTADEILYFGDFQYCTSTGEDTFMGKTLRYEDYSDSSTEWIRYYFDENDALVGYERYDSASKELIELTYYEAFTSEFPEDAVLYFDIPAGFKKYTDVTEFSALWGEEY